MNLVRSVWILGALLVSQPAWADCYDCTADLCFTARAEGALYRVSVEGVDGASVTVTFDELLRGPDVDPPRVGTTETLVVAGAGGELTVGDEALAARSKFGVELYPIDDDQVRCLFTGSSVSIALSSAIDVARQGEDQDACYMALAGQPVPACNDTPEILIEDPATPGRRGHDPSEGGCRVTPGARVSGAGLVGLVVAVFASLAFGSLTGTSSDARRRGSCSR